MKGLLNYKVLGISHHLSDLETRSALNLSDNRLVDFYSLVKSFPSFSGFVLSTCNRTEIYFHGLDRKEILKLWSEIVHENLPVQYPIYNKFGYAMLEHMMKVNCGLDSQIIGDNEIGGQFRTAYKLALMSNTLNGTWQKLINQSIAVSRRIRKSTNFHKGTVSLGYKISTLLNSIESAKKQIVIIGAGEMARSAIKYINKYTNHAELFVINRSYENAHTLADQFDIRVLPWSRLQGLYGQFDGIVSAVNSNQFKYKISTEQNSNTRYVFDLGVPRNIQFVDQNPDTTKYYDLDQMISFNADLAEDRKKEIPKVESIIEDELKRLKKWEQRKRHVITSNSVQ